MWVHLIIARGFLRRHWLLWMLHVVLVAMLALASGLGSVGGLYRLRDNSAVAEHISIDIVIRDGVAGDQIRELASMLGRRPDVRSCEHLDRQDVWRIFQSEIGVQSDGMAEIAALPEIVRVHFQSDFVTGWHVDESARSLKRRLPDRVEAVMVPRKAINDIALERTKLENDLSLAAIGGVLLVICLALLTGSTMRKHGQTLAASRIGRTARWLRLGPFVGIMAGTVLGVLLACACTWLIAPWFFYYLAIQKATFALTAMSAPALLIILVHAGIVIVPSARQRGWQ